MSYVKEHCLQPTADSRGKIGELGRWSGLVPAAATLAVGGRYISRASIWRDEVATWQFSRLPLSKLVHTTVHKQDMVHLPYYVFMHFWLMLGDSTALMRLPSLLAAAVAVAMLTRFAQRWMSTPWSILAGLLLALNPLFVLWSMEAREYSIACMFAVLSVIALVNALQRSGNTRWLVFGVASLGLVLFQQLAILLLIALFVAVVMTNNWRAVARTAAVIVGVELLVMPITVISSREIGQVAWIPKSHLRTFLTAFEGVSGRFYNTDTAVGKVGVIVFLLGALVLVRYLLVRTTSIERQLFYAIAVSGACIPAILLVAVSFIHPLYVSSYLLVSVPSVALVEAALMECLWSVIAKGVPWRFLGTPENHSPSVKFNSRSIAAGFQAKPLRKAAVGCCAFSACSLLLCAVVVQALSAAREPFYVDDFRSAAAALSADLVSHPGRLLIPSEEKGGFTYYASNQLATSLRDSLSFHLAGVADRHPSIAPTCPVAWAIGGEGISPPTSFSLNGGACHLSKSQSFGTIWIARVI